MNIKEEIKTEMKKISSRRPVRARGIMKKHKTITHQVDAVVNTF